MRCNQCWAVALLTLAGWLFSDGLIPVTCAQDDPAATKSTTAEPPAEQPAAADSTADTPEPADSPQPAGADDEPAPDPAAEWKTLSDRRWEIARQLNQMKKDFADADTAGKRKIRADFDNLLFEFQVKLLPRLKKLAPGIFESDPTNIEAGQLVLRNAWDANDIDKSAAIVATLLEADEKSEYVLNTAGAVYCALQDYAKARDVLTQAEAAGKLNPVIGARNLKIASAYLAQAEGNADKAAAELIVEDAYSHNRYAQAIEIGEQQLAAGNASESTLSYLGAAYFAMDRFEEAKKLFDQGKEAQTLNFRAQQLQPDVDKYIELWKTEQELRAAESAAEGDAALPRVVLSTNRGDIELVLCENEAPNTVANFISLIDAGKYDGVAFHRVVPNFVIQGGDPNSLDDNPDNDGTGGPGYTIKCECFAENARKHFRGSLSMAHAGRDTGGSQFFVTHCPTPHLNADEAAGRGHTVFGYVVKGMEVVDTIRLGDRIEKATVTQRRNHEYKPETTPDPEEAPSDN